MDRYDRTFRFARPDLNRLLVSRLHDAAVEYAARPDGGVAYCSGDEERFEEVLAGVRGGVFPDWQVLSFPAGWAGRYQAALEARGAGYEEEVSDGVVEFLVAGHHDPHGWDLG